MNFVLSCMVYFIYVRKQPCSTPRSCIFFLETRTPLYRMLNTVVKEIKYNGRIHIAPPVRSQVPIHSHFFLAVVAAVLAAILAATTAVCDERDIAIVATVAVEEGFTNMGIVGRLVGSIEGAIDLGPVLAYQEGLIRDVKAGWKRPVHIPMFKRFHPQ